MSKQKGEYILELVNLPLFVAPLELRHCSRLLKIRFFYVPFPPRVHCYLVTKGVILALTSLRLACMDWWLVV